MNPPGVLPPGVTGDALEILESFTELGEFNIIDEVATRYSITPECVMNMKVSFVILARRMAAKSHAYNAALTPKPKPTA